jgi:hypothetical protein
MELALVAGQLNVAICRTHASVSRNNRALALNRLCGFLWK